METPNTRTDSPYGLDPRYFIGLILLVLLVATTLRLWRMPEIPPGPHYDEAANGILAAEIASGIKRPIFIPSYTGKEVLFFYLAAATMRLVGVGLLALRLASALAGLLTVSAVFWLVYELFIDDDSAAAPWLAALSTALIATSFWHVLLSRIGFRATTQPLFQALTLAALWRGLRFGALRQRPGPVPGGSVADEPVQTRRQREWRFPLDSSYVWLLLAGLFCGLTGYTYLAARAFPIPLAIGLFALLASDVSNWRRWIIHVALFAITALVSFAPLGIYFLRHPDAFSTRMGQVGPGGDWKAAFDGIWAAFKMLFLRGDPYIRFNLPFRPLFGPVMACFLVVGLGVTVWRFFRPRPTGATAALARMREALLLAWIPAMLLPTALAVNEITPSNLRAVGLIPVVFILPARGLCALLSLFRHQSRLVKRLPLLATGLVLVATGFTTARAYFVEYASRTDLYVASDGDLADIATYLNQADLRNTSVYVGSIHYRHPTLAFLADVYSDIKWLVGAASVVLPPAGEGLYLFPRSAAPDADWLNRNLPDATPIHALTASDGGAAFTGYRLNQPPSPLEGTMADFSRIVQLVRYQVAEAVSGDVVDATLVWRILSSPPYSDLMPFYHLEDAWGSRWGQAEPFQYAAEDWTPGEVVMNRVRIPVAPGAPPGEYALRVGLYSQSAGVRLAAVDLAGRFVGTTVPLTLTLARAQSPPDLNALRISQSMDLETSVGVTLLGANVETTQARPGERVRLTLYWQADRHGAEGQSTQRADLAVQLFLQGTMGDRLYLYEGAPVHGTYPTNRWMDGEIVADRYSPRLPLSAAEASAGDYPLAVAVVTAEGESLIGSAVLGTLTLVASQRDFDVPAMGHVHSATLGDRIELLGYDIDLVDAQPGGVIPLTLYWRALTELDIDYTVFVHLLGPEGQIIAQQDNPPVNGTFPTTLWLPGEVITDPYNIELPTDLRAGAYTLQIGFFIAENGLRLADPVQLGPIVTIQP